MSFASKTLVAVMAGLMFTLHGCGSDDATTTTPAPNSQGIPEIAGDNKDLTTLVTALKAADLVNTLNGAGPFTVFAPSNAAFNKLDPALLKALLADKAKLVQVLTYHVAHGKVLADELTNNEKIPTLLTYPTGGAQNVTVTIIEKTVKINDATVTKADVMAVNGVVHIIDAVLIPPGFEPPLYQNIPEIATAEKLTTLVAALKDGDLVEKLSGKGPFTVFAPTDKAFTTFNTATATKGWLTKLLLPANKAKLQEVLEYHVASGELLAADLKNNESILTLDKQNVFVTITGTEKTVMINGATVTQADNMAVNGVVHVIDAVLVPPNFVPPAEETNEMMI